MARLGHATPAAAMVYLQARADRDTQLTLALASAMTVRGDASGELDEEPLLLCSSDYMHYDTDDPDFILGQTPESMRQAVCYGNALATFGEKVMRGGTP